MESFLMKPQDYIQRLVDHDLPPDGCSVRKDREGGFDLEATHPLLFVNRMILDSSPQRTVPV